MKVVGEKEESDLKILIRSSAAQFSPITTTTTNSIHHQRVVNRVVLVLLLLVVVAELSLFENSNIHSLQQQQQCNEVRRDINQAPLSDSLSSLSFSFSLPEESKSINQVRRAIKC